MSLPATQDNLEKALSRDVVQNLDVRRPETLAQFIELGRVLHASGMFKDITSAQMAVGKMVVGSHMGLDPVQSLMGLHMVQGMPQLHYRTLLAKVRTHPDYDYDIVENTPDSVTIEFYRHGEVCGVSQFTQKDAQRQGTQNMQKYPQNMLIARATSNGVGWYCPDVVFGVPVYTEGEILDVEDYADLPERTALPPKERLREELKAKTVIQEQEPEPVVVVQTETPTSIETRVEEPASIAAPAPATTGSDDEHPAAPINNLEAFELTRSQMSLAKSEAKSRGVDIQTVAGLLSVRTFEALIEAIKASGMTGDADV